MSFLNALIFLLLFSLLGKEVVAQDFVQFDAAQYLVEARKLDNGQNFGTEIREAISLYQQAESLGSADAAYALALIYIQGRGTPQNQARGYSLLRKSALGKNADAAIAWAEILKAEENYQEAYVYASIAQIYAQTQNNFNESRVLIESVEEGFPDLILSLLQEQMTICAENDLLDCGLEENFQEFSSYLDSNDTDENDKAVERSIPITIINDEDEPEERTRKLTEIADFTLKQFSSDYNAQIFYRTEALFEIGVTPVQSGTRKISTHQFTVIIDGGGDPIRIINNFSVGEIELEIKEGIIDALMHGKYPTEVDRKIKRFQVNLIVGSDIEYGKKVEQRDDAELFRITRRLARAIRSDRGNDAESAFADLQTASYGNFPQLARILTGVVGYYQYKDELAPTLIDSIDAVLTLNSNLLISAVGGEYLRREVQINSNPKWAIFANDENAAEINLLTSASVSPIETVRTLRSEYFRYFIQNRRFLEAKQVRETQQLYEDPEYLLDTADVATRVEVILATKQRRIVRDIIDSDGLASVDFDGDDLIVELEKGEITRAEVVCESYYEELESLDNISLPGRPELGGCRLYIFGVAGTIYNATYN